LNDLLVIAHSIPKGQTTFAANIKALAYLGCW